MRVFTGVVLKGAQRGKALGYPTVNIPLSGETISGIYAARVYLKKGDAPYMAAAFADSQRKILEAHLLDFSDDVYDMKVVIELQKKIRENKEFSDDDELQTAIAGDIAKVREYFNNL